MSANEKAREIAEALVAGGSLWTWERPLAERIILTHLEPLWKRYEHAVGCMNRNCPQCTEWAKEIDAQSGRALGKD